MWIATRTGRPVKRDRAREKILFVKFNLWNWMTIHCVVCFITSICFLFYCLSFGFDLRFNWERFNWFWWRSWPTMRCFLVDGRCRTRRFKAHNKFLFNIPWHSNRTTKCHKQFINCNGSEIDLITTTILFTHYICWSVIRCNCDVAVKAAGLLHWLKGIRSRSRQQMHTETFHKLIEFVWKTKQ